MYTDLVRLDLSGSMLVCMCGDLTYVAVCTYVLGVLFSRHLLVCVALLASASFVLFKRAVFALAQRGFSDFRFHSAIQRVAFMLTF